MPEISLLKKLKFAPDGQLLLINASPEWESFFETNQVKLSKPDKPAELILGFAPDKGALEKFMAKVNKSASDSTIIWVAFPKGSSKMQTDLTSDKGWESVPTNEWQYLNLISLDEKWSAFSFRRATGQESKVRRAIRDPEIENVIKPENPYIDTVNRVVNLPEDLAQALAENKEALVFFEKLSFTNRREYVHWVTSAKREETRQKRVLETVAKLDQGLKNPMDKPKT